MRFQDAAQKAVYAYLTGTPSKVLCLVGPPGCGKSECIRSVAKLLQRDVLLLDEDDEMSTSRTLKGPSVWVLEEPEKTPDLKKILSTRTILVTTDLYGTFKSIKDKLQIVKLNVYTPSEVCAILQDCYSVSLDVLKAVSTVCGSDIRYAKTLLDYALQTAKAKQPGHKSIVTSKDLAFDLFKDAEAAFQKKGISGLQSSDLFLYVNLLQTNCVLRTKKVTKVLDAFSVFDVIETKQELPSTDLHTLLEETLLSPLPGTLSMPKIPNPGKKFASLKIAGNTLSNDYCVAIERIACMDIPARCTSKHPWYHEDPDIRALRKCPYEKH